MITEWSRDRESKTYEEELRDSDCNMSEVDILVSVCRFVCRLHIGEMLKHCFLHRELIVFNPASAYHPSQYHIPSYVELHPLYLPCTNPCRTATSEQRRRSRFHLQVGLPSCPAHTLMIVVVVSQVHSFCLLAFAVIKRDDDALRHANI